MHVWLPLGSRGSYITPSIISVDVLYRYYIHNHRPAPSSSKEMKRTAPLCFSNVLPLPLFPSSHTVPHDIYKE